MSYINVKEKKIRFQLFKKEGIRFNLIEDGTGWILKDEMGNIYEGLDEGSSAIYFRKGVEPYSLGYSTGTSTYCSYYPDRNEFKSNLCITRYDGLAVHE